MIKEPKLTLIEQRHGKEYYLYLKHFIRIKNLYNINLPREILNKKYDIKQYQKN